MPLDADVRETSPFGVVETGRVRAAYELARERTLEQNEQLADRIQAQILKVARETFAAAGGEAAYDITASIDVPADNDDAYIAIAYRHSDLAGIRAAITEVRTREAEERAAAEEAEAARLAGTGRVPGLPTRAAQIESPSEWLLREHGADAIRDAVRGAGMRAVRQLPESFTDGREILAAVFNTAAAPPENLRDPGWIPSAQPPLYLTDVVPVSPVSGNQVVYMEETTHAAAAAGVNEGDALPESTFASQERSINVRAIGHRLPVTEFVLEDTDNVRMYLDVTMPMAVRRQLDYQYVRGAGTDASKQILGFAAASGTGNVDAGSPPSGAAGALIDHLYDAMDSVRHVGYGTPTHYSMHPTAWAAAVKSKDPGSGYYGGNPWTGFREMIWGLPVVVSTNWEYAANKKFGACLDLTGEFIRFRLRRDVTTEVGLNADDFSKIQRTIRSYVRGAMQISRAAAICTLTHKA